MLVSIVILFALSILLWIVGLVSTKMRELLLFFIKENRSRGKITLIYLIAFPILLFIAAVFALDDGLMLSIVLFVLIALSILLWIVGLVSTKMRELLLFFIKENRSRGKITLIYLIAFPILLFITAVFALRMDKEDLGYVSKSNTAAQITKTVTKENILASTSIGTSKGQKTYKSQISYSENLIKYIIL